MKQIKTGIIILNWNGLKDTLECLETVVKSKTKEIELKIFVVDNASKKSPQAQIYKKYPQVIFMQNEKNLGFSGGNNTGIKKAFEEGCEYVVLLNNDTTVKPDTFEKLVSSARGYQFHVASPKIYFYPGREFHLKQYQKSEQGKVIWYAGGRTDWANVIPKHIGVDEVDHGQWEKAQETEFATGCCMLLSKKVYETIGGLDATYTAYFEDNDYCMKAKKQGFTIGYCPQAKMWHKNAGSTGGSGSKSQTDLVDQSRFIFAMRYAPLRAKLALIRNRFMNHG